MGRVLVRNNENNVWLDICKKQTFIRSPDNRAWLPIDARKLAFRDGANAEFIKVDCSFDDRFDVLACANLLNSTNCPTSIPADELGSGNGTGSGGPAFDVVQGYPPGYDMPDAGESGFGRVRLSGSKQGYGIKRPFVNYSIESYHDSGVNASYGRGTYANPSIMGSSTFGDGSQITETVYDLGYRAGYFEILFASYDNVGISVDAYFLGQRVATTCGLVRGRSKVEFYLDPAAGQGETRLMIRVRCREGNRWTIQPVGAKANLSVFGLDNEDIIQYSKLYTPEYIGTPIWPTPCHATVFPRESRAPNGQWFYEFHHYIGDDGTTNFDWDLVLDYTSWENADKFEVYHGAERIATTLDPQSELGMLKFRWNPKRYATPVPDLMVRVTSADRLDFSDIQSWYYSIYCPNVAGYRARPWQCNNNIITGSGYSTIEDNFDIDNGIDPGVMSIKFTGLDSDEYTVTVFDSEMEVINSVTGSGIFYNQFFVDSVKLGDTRKRIAVRVDGPLMGSWSYSVGCPIPMLDIELEDKVVPVCEGEVEISVNNIGVIKGADAKFTISSNYPSNNPITVNYSTEDGTASATGESYTGLPAVFGIQNEAKNAATVAVHKQQNRLTVFDASFYRLANNIERNGINSNINQNILTSTANNLSPDAKMIVNSWRHRISNLNGKRWLILTNPINNWAVLCDNVVQSIQNVYGITPTVVTTDYDQVAFSNYDIITIADSTIYSNTVNAGADYIEQVYSNGWSSGIATSILNATNLNRVLHGVLFHSTNLVAAQRANGLLREILNREATIEIDFDLTQTQARNIAQYYLQDHALDYPDSPLLTGITLDRVWDGDFKQVLLSYYKAVSSKSPDYLAATGTATIPVGATSVTVPISTTNSAENNAGEYFYLNISNPSVGTIGQSKGRATISNTPSSGSVDFNFTRTLFSATSWNRYADNISSYGASVIIGVGYSQVEDGRGGVNAPVGGKVAFAAVDYGNTSDQRSSVVRGECAEYPYNPALTYQYKWELRELYNDVNASGAVASAVIASSDYSAMNDIIKINLPAGHKTDLTKVLRSSWALFVSIKSSDGKVYRSQQLDVNLLSNTNI